MMKNTTDIQKAISEQLKNLGLINTTPSLQKKEAPKSRANAIQRTRTPQAHKSRVTKRTTTTTTTTKPFNGEVGGVDIDTEKYSEPDILSTFQDQILLQYSLTPLRNWVDQEPLCDAHEHSRHKPHAFSPHFSPVSPQSSPILSPGGPLRRIH